MTSIGDKTSLLFIISNEGANDDSRQSTDMMTKKIKANSDKRIERLNKDWEEL